MDYGYEMSSEDTGAPQIYGDVKGSLIAMLRETLVEGYGSTAALGWEEYAVDNDTIPTIGVFKNTAGSGSFFRFDGSGAGETTTINEYCSVDVKCYRTMVDIDSGIEQLGTPGIISRIWTDYSVPHSTATPWKIIGDDKSVCLFLRSCYPMYGIGSNYGLGWHRYFFGDYVPYDITNTFTPFLITASLVNPARSTALHSSTACYAFLLRGKNKEVGTFQGTILSGQPNDTSYLTYNSKKYGDSIDNIMSGDVFPLLTRNLILDGANLQIMGHLPGLCTPMCYIELMTSSFTDVSREINGSKRNLFYQDANGYWGCISKRGFRNGL